MDQATTKWGSGLKANQGNVSATEPSRTLDESSRPRVVYSTSAFPPVPAGYDNVPSPVAAAVVVALLSSSSSLLPSWLANIARP